MVLGTMICVEVDGARCAFAPEDVDRVLDGASLEAGAAGEGLAVRVDERTLPLFDLGHLIGRADRPRDRARVVVLHRAERSIAVGIDRFLGASPMSEQRLDPFLDDLAVVRSIATLASGRLAVVLDVEVLMQRAEGTERVDRDALPPEQESVRRVLVVDDSELTRDVLVATLREMGLDVVEAVNGEAALQQLARTPVRMLITDLDMPVLNGFELVRRVRAAPTHARLPIVVLSTRGADEDKARASSLGADAYLVKGGLDLEHLRRVVRRYAGGGS